MPHYTLSIMNKKLSSSFKNDVNNIMTQKGVVVDINEDELACSCSGDIFAHYIYTIGDFKYEFKGTIHKWPNTHILSYKVVKTKKNDDLADIKYIRNPVLFNDFKIESVEVSIIN